MISTITSLITGVAVLSAGPEVLTREDDARYEACGPCCLYASCIVLNHEVSIDELFDKFELDSTGETSIAELSRVASSIGLHPVAAKVDASRVTSLPCPFIAHLEHPSTKPGHFILVLGVTEKGVVYLDPPKIAELHTVEELSKKWTGNVLILSASADAASAFEKQIRSESRVAGLNSALVASSTFLFLAMCGTVWRMRAKAGNAKT